MAEAGSISGALTGDGLADGGQKVKSQIWMHLSEFPPEADATPARVINTSARPIFRITVMSLSYDGREGAHKNSIDAVADWQRASLPNCDPRNHLKYNM
jgi:hypothetical protein